MNVQHTSWPTTAKCSLFFLPNKIFFEFMGGGGREKPNHSAIFIHNKPLTFLKHKKEKGINVEVRIICLVE